MKQVSTSSDVHPPFAPAQEDFAPLQFYEQIVNLVPGLLYVYNHELQANEYSNNLIGSLLGYTAEEVRGMGENVLPSLIHPDDLPRLGRYFEKLKAAQDGQVMGIDYRAIARDGSIVWLRSNDAIFQRDAEGKVVRHIGVSNDVTAQVVKTIKLAKANAQLKQRTAELEQTNAELEQLAYIATHDLKNPLSNLSHLVTMLQDELEVVDADTREILDLMQRASTQANDKLSALVRVAEVRSGELSPQVRVDLAATLAGACAAISQQIETSGATITTDFSAADHVFFAQYDVSSMIENLVLNAIRYAHPDRKPVIQLVSRMDAEGVHLRVQDNGRGLALPGDLEKVFGLFKRAHVEPSGSGIALYIIRKMLERAGGAITVESTQGAWTAFTLTFPNPTGVLQ